MRQDRKVRSAGWKLASVKEVNRTGPSSERRWVRAQPVMEPPVSRLIARSVCNYRSEFLLNMEGIATAKVRGCRYCGKNYEVPSKYPGHCSLDCKLVRRGKAGPTKRKIRISFYRSREWYHVRYRAFKLYGLKCCLCKATNTELHVDHIKPRALYPELSLDINNLQILCRACNLGKGSSDSIRWRTESVSK